MSADSRTKGASVEASILLREPEDPVEQRAYFDALTEVVDTLGLAECELPIYFSYHKRVTAAKKADTYILQDD